MKKISKVFRNEDLANFLVHVSFCKNKKLIKIKLKSLIKIQRIKIRIKYKYYL